MPRTFHNNWKTKNFNTKQVSDKLDFVFYGGTKKQITFSNCFNSILLYPVYNFSNGQKFENLLQDSS